MRMEPKISSRYVLPAVLMFVLMATVWPLGCFASKEAKAIKQIGRCMDRIHTIDRDRNLQKITAVNAAAAMYAEVEAIRKASLSIPDTAAIKAPLRQFLGTWTSPAVIQASIEDGRQLFMADVTGFYLQGLVEHRDGSRTLFPIYRP